MLSLLACAAAATLFIRGLSSRRASASPIALASEISDPVIAWRVGFDRTERLDEDRVLVGDLLIVHVTDGHGWQGGRIEARRCDTGALVWKSTPGGKPGAVVGDCVVVARTKHVAALCLDSGAERWRFTPEPYNGNNLGAFMSAPVADGDSVYVGHSKIHPHRNTAAPSKFFCLDGRTGGRLWDLTLNDGVRAAPAFDTGHIYVVHAYGLSCISKRDRRILWTNPGVQGRQTPPTPWRGRLLMCGGGVRCLSAATGQRVWGLPGGANFAPIAVRDDIAYAPRIAPTQADTFVALDPSTGRILWERVFPPHLQHGAMVTVDSVYVTCADKHLYRLDRRDGALVWKFPVGESAEPVSEGKALYLCMPNSIVRINNR